MKNLLKIASLFVLAILFMSTSLPKKKENIQGLWRMVSTITNGVPNQPITQRRIQEFKKDNTFESNIILHGEALKANSGLYTMVDDTTMVTIHKDLQGNISPLANKYNFTIQNDTLHFYGFYISGPTNDGGLRVSYINELWVKEILE